MALLPVIGALSSHALSGAPHVVRLATRCHLERSERSAFKQIPHFVRDDIIEDDAFGADTTGDVIVLNDMLGTPPALPFAKTPRPCRPSTGSRHAATAQAPDA